MAESISISGTSRKERYEQLLPQIEALIEGEDNWMANLANTAAALKETFDFFWVGFYITDTPDELVLGPFQGPIACTRIAKGKGVCGVCFAQKRPQLVPDVDAFPGHIACSALSRSEVVIPLIKKEKVLGVLDVDSDQLNDFSETDVLFLTQLVELLVQNKK